MTCRGQEVTDIELFGQDPNELPLTADSIERVLLFIAKGILGKPDLGAGCLLFVGASVVDDAWACVDTVKMVELIVVEYLTLPSNGWALLPVPSVGVHDLAFCSKGNGE